MEPLTFVLLAALAFVGAYALAAARRAADESRRARALLPIERDKRRSRR